MGLDLFSILLGAGIGGAVTWAFDKGYITLPPIVLPPLPCPSGQYRNAAGDCVANPTCGTGTHLDTTTHTCVADTTGYARAFYGRRRW